ncbi:hypothetical protein ABEB36_004300 [Hypothenemus hampei]|uniref:Cytochrome P450 n=1 Tax=Hypothenemus hampei TaxID=57062 RepID=A0ABD1F2W3_HYPHA
MLTYLLVGVVGGGLWYLFIRPLNHFERMVYQFTLPTLMVKDPELIKELTIKYFDHFTDHRAFIRPDIDPLWSNNLFALTDQKWREMRTTLSGFFTSSKMKHMFEVINEVAQNFSTHLIKKEENLIELEMKDTFARKDMINLLLETRKGHKIEEGNTIETGYATVQEDSYFGRFQNLHHYCMQYFQNSIFPDKVKFKQTKYMSDDDITSQVLIFFFAGFDTVSTALCYSAHELAMNKNIQDRFREEIRETHKLHNGILTYDSLLKMKYMDMVYCEILRKWPPVFLMDRVCTKPYTIEPKYPDEKTGDFKMGDMFWLPMFGLHRDPKYFLKPEVFDPERFSDENRDQIIPYSYIPFGSGPRNCIGSRFAILESKALIYNLLLNFEIVPTKKTANPLKHLRGSFQNAVEGGFHVGLKRIKQ